MAGDAAKSLRVKVVDSAAAPMISCAASIIGSCSGQQASCTQHDTLALILASSYVRFAFFAQIVNTSQDDEFIPLLDIQPGQGNDGTAAAAGSTHQQQKQQRAVGYQPPWLLRLAHFGSPLMRLHNEIVAFCQMLAPTAEEVASRASSLDSLKEVVRSIWPVADVKVFGSYETGLYTPASDTDVVVVGSGNVNAQTGGCQRASMAARGGGGGGVGNYETGLYTPASDTDVVVVGSGNVNAQTGVRV